MYIIMLELIEGNFILQHIFFPNHSSMRNSKCTNNHLRTMERELMELMPSYKSSHSIHNEFHRHQLKGIFATSQVVIWRLTTVKSEDLSSSQISPLQYWTVDDSSTIFANKRTHHLFIIAKRCPAKLIVLQVISLRMYCALIVCTTKDKWRSH